MNIKIENCNNIDEANINIEEGTLNIKYAMNGTGKSTIAKSLSLENLKELQTFGEIKEPNITKNKNIKAEVFNEDFINNIVFKGNDVINNSFEIFIKCEQYDEKRKSIDNMLRKLTFNIFEDEELSVFFEKIMTINTMISYKADKGSIDKKGTYRSILQKENIFTVPKELTKYKDFIVDKKNNMSWVEWMLKGFEYDEKKKCPFCTTGLVPEYEQEKDKFKKTYKKSDVKNLNEFVDTLEIISEYIDKEKYNSLMKCVKESTSEDEITMVFTKFMSESTYLLNKMSQIKDFDSYKVNKEEINELDKIVSNLSISIENLEYYKTKKMTDIINNINLKIQGLLEQIKTLKEEIGGINGLINGIIQQSKKEINDFLNLAGFNYEFDIIKDGNEKNIRTILKYDGKNENKVIVNNISNHLSWGERNAFALVLFMYYSLKKNPNLIILDDPISSFDGNKKYAIVNRLFENRKDKKSFFGKTVLMLTHDFEPIIDFGINHKPNGETKISYLKNDFGKVSENNINPKKDIKSIIKIYYENAKNEELNIISRINFLRKYIEYINVDETNEKFISYNILSSIIHGEKLTKKINNDYFDLSDDEIEMGDKYISQYINNFNSKELIKRINSSFILAEYKSEDNNYIKTQLFRMYLEISNNREKLKDKVLLKFVDEIYHIENDYIFSFNLIKFDTVPSYIINKIDEFMLKEMEDR